MNLRILVLLTIKKSHITVIRDQTKNSQKKFFALAKIRHLFNLSIYLTTNLYKNFSFKVNISRTQNQPTEIALAVGYFSSIL